MIKKITCPICKEQNEEMDKVCKNKKCKWELTYAKDGAFVGLSENEIRQYNDKLSSAKQKYKDKLTIKEEVPLLEELEVGNSINSNYTKLSDLRKGDFETIIEYNNRILQLGYVQIGNYKLNKYNPDKGCYSILIIIDKKPNQKLEYDFDKLIELSVEKDLAKKTGLNKEFPLLAKLSIGIVGVAVGNLHEINRDVKNLLDPVVNKIKFNENKFTIKKLKFESLEIEISENELIKLAKENWLLIAGIVALSWLGI